MDLLAMFTGSDGYFHPSFMINCTFSSTYGLVRKGVHAALAAALTTFGVRVVSASRLHLTPHEVAHAGLGAHKAAATAAKETATLLLLLLLWVLREEKRYKMGNEGRQNR